MIAHPTTHAVIRAKVHGAAYASYMIQRKRLQRKRERERSLRAPETTEQREQRLSRSLKDQRQS